LFHALEDIKSNTCFGMAVTPKFQILDESRRELVIKMLPLD